MSNETAKDERAVVVAETLSTHSEPLTFRGVPVMDNGPVYDGPFWYAFGKAGIYILRQNEEEPQPMYMSKISEESDFGSGI